MNDEWIIIYIIDFICLFNWIKQCNRYNYLCILILTVNYPLWFHYLNLLYSSINEVHLHSSSCAHTLRIVDITLGYITLLSFAVIFVCSLLMLTGICPSRFIPATFNLGSEGNLVLHMSYSLILTVEAAIKISSSNCF